MTYISGRAEPTLRIARALCLILGIAPAPAPAVPSRRLAASRLTASPLRITSNGCWISLG